MTPRSRRRYAGAILVALSIVVAAFLAELIVRLAAPQILSMPSPAVDGVRIGEPNARGRVAVRGQYDTRVQFNSQGFRSDAHFTVAPSPKRTRIAVLGDSFVFGWGSWGQQSFPAQLEAVLRSAKRDTEVINAGILAAVLWMAFRAFARSGVAEASHRRRRQEKRAASSSVRRFRS